ncbi:adenosylmethionine--8-amino-7-oxononanoate transaminase [Legionella oakridgensis]|uniref:Adenosylmethionine-8-amino-7-oxononanoate aminotransferase n=2 Tax=Legionella oakridgensis TaxID=29423 RepID=W0BFK3_9GAMM|nr:adenosylmethionine--8-amino-7-oxononanoate transaminase [Legionella oakridgensis]AHE67402.1 adenosylmethionine-8-amino-7-oxononanoate transaminase [Legionella oakridgensis ATCC 33761 = DSM 21215]
MVNTGLIERDLKHIWHPCSQMKDFEQSPPFIVYGAKGSYLETNHGPIIDAISSWWCKSLGHGYPEVITAIQNQLNRFEHIISATTTYPEIVMLAEELAALSNRQHVFFASDGSSAVEIAMKLALHASQLQGHPERNQFISLKNSYHGETLATLSVSDLGLYKKPYQSFSLDCHFLQTIPYVSGEEDSLWQTCDSIWEHTLAELEKIKDKACALLVEPLIQGAGGMRCYSADFLRKLALWTKANGIYLIADEIMTGLGRTGQWLACHHAGVDADLICLSKGLTSGTLPLSCVLIDHSIYDLFYDDFAQGKSFLHSHTYSGNPLAVSAALATIQVMQQHAINQKAKTLGLWMQQCFSEVAKQTGKISNIRSLGACVAGDLDGIVDKRIGFQLYQEALNRGALLRPMGNTLYWLPPLTTDKETIEKLAEITLNSIRAVY